MLLDILDRHKAHVGSSYRFADRLGVGRIVLVGLDVGFDELRCHQVDGVTKTCQLARPVVGTAAGFHADQASWQVHEERGHLVAPYLLLDDWLAKLVDPVQLKHVLCQIDANCRNLHVGRSCLFKWLVNTSTLAHCDAV